MASMNGQSRPATAAVAPSMIDCGGKETLARLVGSGAELAKRDSRSACHNLGQ